MPKPAHPLFQTPHDSALAALGAPDTGGQRWGTFDVSMQEARKGKATRYFLPLWNAPRKSADQPDSTGKALVRRGDGTWWYHVRRPGPGDKSPQWKAQWASLKRCAREGLPIVGVLKDRHSKRCALAVTFDCGPFLGTFEDSEVWMQVRPRDATAARLVAELVAAVPDARHDAALERENYFNATDPEDERVRRLREVVQRRGQAEFRQALLAAYEGRCAVTGCDAVDALEAAHIVGYLGPSTQHVTNGLLLRADIHTLFDLDLLTICPATLRIHLAPALRASSYGELHGQALTCPAAEACRPSRLALGTRWRDPG